LAAVCFQAVADDCKSAKERGDWTQELHYYHYRRRVDAMSPFYFAPTCVAMAVLCTQLRSALAQPMARSLVLTTSRYWLNYRHTTDAFAVQSAIDELPGGVAGGPALENLFLMAGDESSNPRNPFPAQQFLPKKKKWNIALSSRMCASSAAASCPTVHGDAVNMDRTLAVISGRPSLHTSIHSASAPKI